MTSQNVEHKPVTRGNTRAKGNLCRSENFTPMVRISPNVEALGVR